MSRVTVQHLTHDELIGHIENYYETVTHSQNITKTVKKNLTK